MADGPQQARAAQKAMRIAWLRQADSAGKLPVMPPQGGTSLGMNMMFEGLIALGATGIPHITDKGRQYLVDTGVPS